MKYEISGTFLTTNKNKYQALKTHGYTKYNSKICTVNF